MTCFFSEWPASIQVDFISDSNRINANTLLLTAMMRQLYMNVIRANIVILSVTSLISLLLSHNSQTRIYPYHWSNIACLDLQILGIYLRETLFWISFSYIHLIKTFTLIGRISNIKSNEIQLPLITVYIWANSTKYFAKEIFLYNLFLAIKNDALSSL